MERLYLDSESEDEFEKYKNFSFYKNVLKERIMIG